MRMVLALWALLLPAMAAARPVLSLRLAYAPALGSAVERVPMRDALGAQAPLQADALWAFGAAAVGPYLSIGPGFVSGCDGGASCGGLGVRVGVEALHVLPPLDGRSFSPWIGAGVGWEWASRSRERLGNEVTWTWSGPEAHVQLGGEWPLGRRVTAGPYLLVAGGRFTRVSLETPVASEAAPLRDRAFHGWIHLGVRGTVRL